MDPHLPFCPVDRIPDDVVAIQSHVVPRSSGPSYGCGGCGVYTAQSVRDPRGEHQTNAWELGRSVRKYMCEEKGLVSVAAPGFEAPGVVVVHHEDAGVAGKFVQAGTQIAAGVPFMIGEHEDTKTFRIGLFGLDKLADPQKTLGHLKDAFEHAVHVP